MEHILKFLLILVNNDPAIALLNIYPRKIKPYVHIRTCTSMFIALLLNFSKKIKKLETTQIVIDRIMDKNKNVT